MAEIIEFTTADGSTPLIQDSDEIKEMYCEECERHTGEYATAVAFCVDCVEYKCKTCRKYHRRHFKTHKTQDSDSMPQDFYFEKCLTHPQQLVKYYCSECSKEACQACKNNEHDKCGDVNHLPTVASGIQNSDDLKDLQQNLDKLSADIKGTEWLLNAKSEVIDKQEEKAAETCKEHADKLIKAYKQQHQDLLEDFDKKIEETIAKLKKERLKLVQQLSEKERKFKNKIAKAETDMKKEVVSTNTEFKVLRSEHLNLVGNFRVLTAELEQDQKSGQNCKILMKLNFTKELCEDPRRNIKQIQQAYIQTYKLKTSEIKPTEQSQESATRFYTFKEISALERRVVFI
ncbi:E3 ubiquitin-protein ligase TRIM33-like [Ruditapes philippinarum]|uniref:E3 ubiquitin-protein ligase TRIM33-like n=1 Tax=Ruditapes philippinarum TaxID=129788 RepID=UPI00295B0E0C|nr:E3 ubiquitin-protein ligase TRIM33-like [Ruditapes philippinarum]